MALPPAHMLIGAACGEVARGEEIPRTHAWAAGAAIAMLPDMDSVLLLSLGRGAETHGLFTHTLIAAALVALLAWMLGGRRWGALAVSAYLSHLVVDVLRDGDDTSVFLLGPFTTASVPPLAPIFPTIPFEWGDGYAFLPELHGPRPLERLALQTLIGLGVLVGAIALMELRSRLRARQVAPDRSGPAGGAPWSEGAPR